MSDRRPGRVAVVGGAGFIGTHVVERLVRGGLTVLVIDDLSHPCGVPLPAAVELLEASGGSDAARAALERFRPQALVHLAAKGGVNRALRHPAGHIRDVLAESVGCFAAAQAAGCASVVIASSGGAVYGDPRVLPAPERLRPAPRSAYGAEKLCEETYLATIAQQGVRTLALRYGNVYGPRQ
ncbi:MAG: UDP-glucose 4-epimerase, partial [Candidatus Aeolococcus gillhamiae]